MANTILKSESSARVYTIDLLSKVTPSISIGKQWVISFPAPAPLKFLKLPRLSHKKVSLQINNLSCPDCWEVETDKLLSITLEGKTTYVGSGSKVDIELRQEDTFFQLTLNPDAIKDCTECQLSSPKQYKITFQVKLFNENGKEIDSVKETLQIVFSEIHVTPTVEVTIDTNFQNFKYRDKDLAIGKLRVSNLSTLKYCPGLDGLIRINAYCDGTLLPDDVVYLDFEKALNDFPINNDSETSGFSYRSLDNSSRTPLSCIQFPIRVNFGKIGNPYEKSKEISIRISGTYSHSNDLGKTNELNPVTASFTLEGDNQIPELIVTMRDFQSREDREIKNGSVNRIPIAEFLPGNGLEFYNVIKLQNKATDGETNTGVFVANLSHTVSLIPRVEKAIRFSSSRHSLSSVFQPRGKGNTISDLQAGVLLRSQKNNALTFEAGFESDLIREICYEWNGKKNYQITVRVDIEFDYYIDDLDYSFGEHDASRCNHFKFSLDMKLHQLPYPKWLGIDFGTSAIVSEFGEDNVLNLHEVKDQVFASVEDEDTPDMFEKGTPFLSSNIVYRGNALVRARNLGVSQLLSENSGSTDYHALAVCLSPTTSQEDQNNRYLLPCLKLLMGYNVLPNVNSYKDFKYQSRGDDGESLQEYNLIATNSAIDEEPDFAALAHVNALFGEVYRELLQYYIKPCVQGDIKKVNKLVLTVPNTYTPVHLETLREIIEESFSDMNIRDVRFVSESDAVACYYQSHWNAINKKLKRNEKQSLKDFERVLVYDMGAGTLDVTLFEKSRSEDGKLEVTVKGKIGISKAGNYLDSVLARRLAKIYPDLEDVALPERIIDADSMEVARNLKSFIKNTLKPQIGHTDSIDIPAKVAKKIGIKQKTLGSATSISIDLKEDILESQEFVSYVEDCTTSFMDNFFQFLGYNSPLQIDTVILSGRSAKMKPIQKSLQQAMKKWTENSDMKMVSISSFATTQGAEFDLAKTVVVEGALNYASLYSDADAAVSFHSSNIMACYGVIYKDEYGATKYVELLNPRTERPKNIVENNGMTVKTYETEPITLNLSATKQMILVQTYSRDTVEDWDSGKREYITEMARIDVTVSNRSHVEVAVAVDENNSLSLLVNNVPRPNIAPTRVDIDNISTKMSLWPLINTRN